MWLLALAALVWPSAVVWPPAAFAPAQPATWQAVAAGVERLTLVEADAELLRFDLRRYRADVIVPGAGAPLTAAAARAARGAALAINGGFFDTDGRSLGLRIGRGKTFVGLRPRVDWGVLLVEPGRARIVHSRDYAATGATQIDAAVQVGPRVLIAGVVPALKPQSSRRTAVAVDPSGRFLTVIVTRARVSASAVGAALAGLGLTDAMLLDGGPSTQLSAAIGPLSLEVEGGYAVPDLLLLAPIVH